MRGMTTVSQTSSIVLKDWISILKIRMMTMMFMNMIEMIMIMMTFMMLIIIEMIVMMMTMMMMIIIKEMIVIK